MTLICFHIPLPSQQLFNLSLWLIEIEINMLDEKLIKFLALQRIHQLFPSRVQPSPGSVGTHQLASGGHHTEGAHVHTCHHIIRSPLYVCEWSPCLHGESELPVFKSSCVLFMGLIKHHGFFLKRAGTRWQPQLSYQTWGSLL